MTEQVKNGINSYLCVKSKKHGTDIHDETGKTAH